MAEPPSRLSISQAGVATCTLEVSADLRYARHRPTSRSGLATRKGEQGQYQSKFRSRTGGGDVHQSTYCARPGMKSGMGVVTLGIEPSP